MDRFPDRQQGRGARGDSAEAARDTNSSKTVKWRNISIRSDATDSRPVQESPEGPASITADTDSGLEAVGSERLLGTVLTGLSTPALVVDAEGTVVSLNESACKLFDTTESAAVGRPSAALHDGAALVPRVLATGEAVEDHRETITVSGTRYNLSRTVVPFRTEAGTVVGAMETVHSWSE